MRGMFDWLRDRLGWRPPTDSPVPSRVTGRFQVGQAWTWHGAPSPSSRVVIGALDDEGFIRIVSVAVTEVPFRARDGRIVQDVIFHAPVEEAALDASVIECTGTAQVPDGFVEALQGWREQRRIDAGFYSVSIAEIVRLYGGVLTGDGQTQGGDS